MEIIRLEYKKAHVLSGCLSLGMDGEYSLKEFVRMSVVCLSGLVTCSA